MKKIVLFIFTAFLVLSTNIFAQNNEMDKEAAKLYNQGNKQKKSGNVQGALESYKKALEISKDYRIYYQLGSIYKKKREFENAESAVKKCLELKPDFYTAYNLLGTTYYSWGKYDKAVENFTKFKDSVKEKKLKKRAGKYIGLAYTKLGSTALQEKNYKKAEEYLKLAVSNYNYDAAYLKLADMYVELGKFDEALKAADNAINYRGKKSKIPKGAPYFYKGMAFKGLHDNAKAKENFKIASSDKQYRDRSKHEIKYLN